MRKIEVPSSLSTKIYLGLSIAIVLILGIFYIVYLVGASFHTYIGLAFVVIGFIPFLFTLRPQPRPAAYIEVKRSDHPKFIATLEEISQATGVPIPREVLITPTTEIYVEGLLSKKLVVGIVGLRYITPIQFKAIMAHEFAHFYGKDTIVGGLLARVSHSLESSARFGGKWWNVMPVLECALVGLVILAFYKFWHFFFNIVYFAYSRQFERRADYISSRIAGSENTAKALTNYSAAAAYFETAAYSSIVNLLNQNMMFTNVFATMAEQLKGEGMEKTKAHVLQTQRWSPFSTHPTLKSRLKYLRKISESQNGGNSSHEDDDLALSLLNGPEDIEAAFSKALTELVAQRAQQAKFETIHEDAKRREGRCSWCEARFSRLDDLLKHESEHATRGRLIKQSQNYPNWTHLGMVHIANTRCLSCFTQNFTLERDGARKNYLATCNSCTACYEIKTKTGRRYERAVGR